MSFKVVVPECADETDLLDSGLVTLTQAISSIEPGRVAHGCLGGSYGYGADFENDVFMMHHFCWCERDDCPWCAGCDCPETAYHYLVDGKEVGYRDYQDFYMRHVYGMTDAEILAKGLHAWDLKPVNYERKSKEANGRRHTVHDAVCSHCRGEQFIAEGAVPKRSAPNFWHKQSGLRVWWYKYIGRGMEVASPVGVDINAVLNECLASLPATPQGER